MSIAHLEEVATRIADRIVMNPDEWRKDALVIVADSIRQGLLDKLPPYNTQQLIKFADQIAAEVAAGLAARNALLKARIAVMKTKLSET